MTAVALKQCTVGTKAPFPLVPIQLATTLLVCVRLSSNASLMTRVMLIKGAAKRKRTLRSEKHLESTKDCLYVI